MQSICSSKMLIKLEHSSENKIMSTTFQMSLGNPKHPIAHGELYFVCIPPP